MKAKEYKFEKSFDEIFIEYLPRFSILLSVSIGTFVILALILSIGKIIYVYPVPVLVGSSSILGVIGIILYVIHGAVKLREQAPERESLLAQEVGRAQLLAAALEQSSEFVSILTRALVRESQKRQDWKVTPAEIPMRRMWWLVTIGVIRVLSRKRRQPMTSIAPAQPQGSIKRST